MASGGRFCVRQIVTAVPADAANRADHPRRSTPGGRRSPWANPDPSDGDPPPNVVVALPYPMAAAISKGRGPSRRRPSAPARSACAVTWRCSWPARRCSPRRRRTFPTCRRPPPTDRAPAGTPRPATRRQATPSAEPSGRTVRQTPASPGSGGAGPGAIRRSTPVGADTTVPRRLPTLAGMTVCGDRRPHADGVAPAGRMSTERRSGPVRSPRSATETSRCVTIRGRPRRPGDSVESDRRDASAPREREGMCPSRSTIISC